MTAVKEYFFGSVANAVIHHHVQYMQSVDLFVNERQFCSLRD